MTWAKMTLRVGLRTKFIVIILVLASSIVSFFTFVQINSNTSRLRNDLAAQGRAFAELATKPIGDTFLLYRDSGQARIAQQMERFADLNETISNIVVVDNQGKVVAKLHEGAANVTPQEAQTFEQLIKKDSKGLVNAIIQPYIEDFGAHRYSLVYYVSNESIDSLVRTQLRDSLLLGIASLAVSAAAMYILMNYFFVSPLRAVSHTAIQISEGNLNLQIPKQRSDEIGDVATAVNRMALSLEDDIKKMQELDKMKTEFMIIASHNLRTPLTIIAGYLEQLKEMQLNDEAKGSIEAISSGANELRVLAEDLLTISSLEAGQTILNKQVISAKELLESLLNDAKRRAEQKGVIFSGRVTLAGEAVLGSRPHLYNALWNIADNAIKFTDKDKHVWINAHSDGVYLTVDFQDEGIGITEEEQAKLFTKFHRGTSVMDYDYKGVGVGLYVTKLILNGHGGEIRVTSRPGMGTYVTVRLKLHKA